MTDEELKRLEELAAKALKLTQLALEPNSRPAFMALEAVESTCSVIPALVEEVRRLRRALLAASSYGGDGDPVCWGAAPCCLLTPPRPSARCLKFREILGLPGPTLK